jgi:hypothetical protein
MGVKKKGKEERSKEEKEKVGGKEEKGAKMLSKKEKEIIMLTKLEEEEVVMLTKSELEMMICAREGYNLAEKGCLVVGSILAGVGGWGIIEKVSMRELDEGMVVLFLVGMGLNVWGFYLQYRKDKNSKRIIKKHLSGREE